MTSRRVAASGQAAALADARSDAGACTACDLHLVGTQTVFGQGPVPAPAMLVGEQPGDQEDMAGEPFVGPAGGVLDRALGEIGVDRGSVYVTNAVKHFKWEQRGKRRIHQRPNRTQIVACHRWLEIELEQVEPRLVVALGAVAAESLLGPGVRVGSLRGTPVDSDLAPFVAVTAHPSSVLRQRDSDARAAAYEELRDDLARAFGWLGAPTQSQR